MKITASAAREIRAMDKLSLNSRPYGSMDNCKAPSRLPAEAGSIRIINAKSDNEEANTLAAIGTSGNKAAYAIEKTQAKQMASRAV